MSILSIFRKPPPVRDAGELSTFIDENAAFVAQKGIYEYSRARAGHYAKVLFSEKMFLDALERSRWNAFPLGLAMVGELADGVLFREPTARQPARQDALRAMVLAIFDRYPLPAALDAAEWQRARATLDGRLQPLGARPAKRSFEIPDQYVHEYFGLMPIDAKLKAPDFPVMHNYLKLTLTNIHIELTKRMDLAAVLRSLPAEGE